MASEKSQVIYQMKKALVEDLQGLPIAVVEAPDHVYLSIPARYVKRLSNDTAYVAMRLRFEDGETVDIEISREYGFTMAPVSRKSRLKTVDKDGRVRPEKVVIDYNEFSFFVHLVP